MVLCWTSKNRFSDYMYRVKITVVKKFTPKDVIGRDYIRPESGKPIPPCHLQEGQEFLFTETGQMPQDFCPNAWYGIFNEVSLLTCGGSYPDWTGKDTIYATCPDGIRPVIFRLDRIKT